MVQGDKFCIVFLIHAETTVREFIERVLHDHGSLVCSASNPRSALQFLRGYRDDIHLVIIDYDLPGMTGIELADLIARERPHTHVVLTADESTGDFPTRWRSRLLNKPLQAEILRRQVEKALETVPCEAVSAESHSQGFRQ